MSGGNIPDPMKILTNASGTYAECKTYRDHGEVEVIFHSGSPNEQRSRTWFSTFFKRPKMFRFAFMMQMTEPFNGPMLVHKIWCDGKTTHFKSPTWPFEQQESLSMAIAAATGISNGSAYRIPNLLMPDLIEGSKALRVTEAKYVAEETIAEQSCHRVSATDASRKTDFWISQSRSIILCVQEHVELGPNWSKSFDQKQLDSFGAVVSWFLTQFTQEMIHKMDPIPVITNTFYRDVVLNASMPDSCFSEDGRA